MKTAISIPDPIFESAEKLAKRLGITRSQLYSNAVNELIEKYRYSGVTEQLNAVYKLDSEVSRLQQDLADMQNESLNGEEW